MILSTTSEAQHADNEALEMTDANCRPSLTVDYMLVGDYS